MTVLTLMLGVGWLCVWFFVVFVFGGLGGVFCFFCGGFLGGCVGVGCGFFCCWFVFFLVVCGLGVWSVCVVVTWVVVGVWGKHFVGWALGFFWGTWG